MRSSPHLRHPPPRLRPPAKKEPHERHSHRILRRHRRGLGPAAHRQAEGPAVAGGRGGGGGGHDLRHRPGAGLRRRHQQGQREVHRPPGHGDDQRQPHRQGPGPGPPGRRRPRVEHRRRLRGQRRQQRWCGRYQWRRQCGRCRGRGRRLHDQCCDRGEDLRGDEQLRRALRGQVLGDDLHLQRALLLPRRRSERAHPDREPELRAPAPQDRLPGALVHRAGRGRPLPEHGRHPGLPRRHGDPAAHRAGHHHLLLPGADLLHDRRRPGGGGPLPHGLQRRPRAGRGPAVHPARDRLRPQHAL